MIQHGGVCVIRHPQAEREALFPDAPSLGTIGTLHEYTAIQNVKPANGVPLRECPAAEVISYRRRRGYRHLNLGVINAESVLAVITAHGSDLVWTCWSGAPPGPALALHLP